MLSRPAVACEIAVRVIPRASRPGIAGMRQDAVLVRVSSPPVDGAANAEVIEVLAHALSVPRRAITITGGQRSRTKRVAIDGLTRDAVMEALTARDLDR